MEKLKTQKTTTTKKKPSKDDTQTWYVMRKNKDRFNDNMNIKALWFLFTFAFTKIKDRKSI